MGLTWTVAPSAKANLFQFDNAQWAPASPKTGQNTEPEQSPTTNTGNIFKFSEESWLPAEKAPTHIAPIQNTPALEEPPNNNKPQEAPPEKEVDYTPPPHPSSSAFEVTVSIPTNLDNATALKAEEERPSFDIRLLDQNWRAPDFGEVNPKEEMLPINVRMTLLPPPPAPTKNEAAKMSAVKRGHIEFKSRKTNNNPEQSSAPPTDQAACAAINAYKKRQLEAMQSDRQTLKALQEAVHSLNLNKQLDFILENGKGQPAVSDQDSAQISSPTSSIN